MPWLLLLLAGLFEIFWATMMKLSNGFTAPLPATLSIIGMVASVVLLGIAMKSLPLGTSYMVWTGIGAVGSFIAGIVFLGETVTPLRLAAAGLVVVGLAMLQLTASH